jgi:hypothetical protein
VCGLGLVVERLAVMEGADVGMKREKVLGQHRGYIPGVPVIRSVVLLACGSLCDVQTPAYNHMHAIMRFCQGCLQDNDTATTRLRTAKKSSHVSCDSAPSLQPKCRYVLQRSLHPTLFESPLCQETTLYAIAQAITRRCEHRVRHLAPVSPTLNSPQLHARIETVHPPQRSHPEGASRAACADRVNSLSQSIRTQGLKGGIGRLPAHRFEIYLLSIPTHGTSMTDKIRGGDNSHGTLHLPCPALWATRSVRASAG